MNNPGHPETDANPSLIRNESPHEKEGPTEIVADIELTPMERDFNYQGQPDPINYPNRESGEGPDEKESISEIVVGTDLTSVVPSNEPQKVGRFHFVKSFLAGLFIKQKFTQKGKDKQQASKANVNLPVEMDGHEDLVEKRLENLFNEQHGMGSVSLPSDELPKEENQPNLILTSLSQDTLPDRPQPENPPEFNEKESTPPEDSFISARLLTPFFPQDLDELEGPEERLDSNREDNVSEKIIPYHNDEDSDISEDPNLNIRFQSILGPEEITGSSQPAFIMDDWENLNPLGEEEEKPNTDRSFLETTETTDVSLVEQSEDWNKAFTTDPTHLLNVPYTPGIAVEEKKDEPVEYLSSFQERSAQSKNPEDEKDKNSLSIQDELAQIENLPDENEEYPEIINEGLAQSANATEEEPSNPWETEPDWSSIANPEETPGLSGSSTEILEKPNQVENVAASPEKGIIASIPLFLKILIISLLVIDLAIIGIAGSSYLKILTPNKPTPTVVPTEILYVYPNALKLTGGWIIQLYKGHLVGEKWSPLSAEWLIDTTFRRVVALPWSKQLEAVILTLKQGDQIELYMVNNDVITYQVENVIKVSQEDTSFLKRNTPALIIILYRTDSQDRWVIICGQK